MGQNSTTKAARSAHRPAGDVGRCHQPRDREEVRAEAGLLFLRHLRVTRHAAKRPRGRASEFGMAASWDLQDAMTAHQLTSKWNIATLLWQCDGRTPPCSA